MNQQQPEDGTGMDGMGSRPPARLSDLDLEAYLDGEAEPGLAAEVATALREDPAFRARLGSIRAADAAVLASVSEPVSEVRGGTGVSLARVLGVGLAAAAVVALCVGAWMLAVRPAPGPGPRVAEGAEGAPEPGDVALAGDADASLLRPMVSPTSMIRVSLGTVRPRAAPPLTELIGPPDPFAPAARRARAQQDSRASLDSSESPEEATGEDGEPPDDPMLVIGRGVRSLREGNEVLDLLSPADQVRACAAWAGLPRTRPIAFQRLADLSRDRSLRREIGLVIDTMSRERDLRPWLRMHGLDQAEVIAGPVQ